MIATSPNRLHAFEGIDNARDYGGYAAGGMKVATGRLLRAGHQARATDADLDQLAALDVRTVVDLRRPGERREQPSRRAPGFSGQIIQSDHDDGQEAPHITFLKANDLTETGGRAFMTGVYQRMPYAPGHVDVFSRYFQALADAQGPVLIHCAAGKDRTGLLAALTHHVLGVGADDRMADYLLTNTAVDLEGKAPSIARQLEKMTGRKASHAAVVAFLGVEPGFLNAAWQTMADRSGSVDGYLEAVLGVDGPMRERIRQALCS